PRAADRRKAAKTSIRHCGRSITCQSRRIRKRTSDLLAIDPQRRRLEKLDLVAVRVAYRHDSATTLRIESWLYRAVGRHDAEVPQALARNIERDRLEPQPLRCGDRAVVL